MNSPVVLITGASSGIGKSLAEAYGERGAHLALLARRRDRLDELAARWPGHAKAIVCDVCSDGDVERAVSEAREAFGRLDIVIANAGFAVGGSVDRLALDDYRRQFETNVFGLLRTVKAAIEPLRATRGRLALMGSVNGYVGLPGYSAYVMSKFAVRGLADSLRCELAGEGISVTHLAPGFVESEIRKIDRKGRYREEAREPIPPWLVMNGQVAAAQIMKAIEDRKDEAVITGHGKVATFLQRHTPALVSGVLRYASPRIVTTADKGR